MLGHTHKKVDQFFSAVSNGLNNTAGSCILTPLGMQEFIKKVVKGSSQGYRVIDVKICEYIHDFTVNGTNQELCGKVTLNCKLSHYK